MAGADLLRVARQRFILYCMDLSFGHDVRITNRSSGGWMRDRGGPRMSCVMPRRTAATLMPRDMIENERGSGHNPAEAVEKKGVIVGIASGLVGFSTPAIKKHSDSDPRLLRCLCVEMTAKTLHSEAI